MNAVSLLLALTIVASAAATLGVAGAQLVGQGQQSIAQSNAWADQQNSQWAHYCEVNGSQTVGCPGPRVSAGIDQPQGQAGEREVQLGDQVLGYSVIPIGLSIPLAIAYALVLSRARLSSPSEPPEVRPDAPK